MTNLSEWKSQFLKTHVQAQDDKGGEFLSSETVVVVSGPPSLENIHSLDTLVPIGLVQNVSVAQQKQLQQIFEVGSRKPYFVPGRTMISAGISRILFDGPSLMYSMYINSAVASGGALSMPDYDATGRDDTQLPTLPVVNTAVPVPSENAKTANPGMFFINLASSFFNNPMGLGFVLYDGNQQAYGGFYLEGCYVQSHQFNVSSQQTILVENVSLRCTDLRPLAASSI